MVDVLACWCIKKSFTSYWTYAELNGSKSVVSGLYIREV